MVIKELSKNTMYDWLEYFDNTAFTDHQEWNSCYCTAFYYPKPDSFNEQTNKRRDYAIWLIENKKMKGYLAYEDNKVIGWVNVNDKSIYPRLKEINNDEEKVLSIACFIVQKENRGKGVATKLLEKILENAKNDGYSIIEAYPKRKAKSEYGIWNDPYEMYKKSGFVDYKIKKTSVVRKIVK